jgi:hypothetical protein
MKKRDLRSASIFTDKDKALMNAGRNTTRNQIKEPLFEEQKLNCTLSVSVSLFD